MTLHTIKLILKKLQNNTLKMTTDNNLPTGYIEEDEQTEEEFAKVLSECEEFDDSDEVREQ